MGIMTQFFIKLMGLISSPSCRRVKGKDFALEQHH
jgi:hypothetical protein